MFRQIFRGICSSGVVNSSCLAVAPVLLDQRRNVLLFVFLLVPMAIGSPVTQVIPPSRNEKFAVDSLLTGTGRTDIENSQSRSEFPLSSFAIVPSSNATSTQSLDGSAMGTENRQNYERYLYLLLTAGLILLAFRPGGATVTGRH